MNSLRCTLCEDPQWAAILSEKITGNPSDAQFLALTDSAAKGLISEEEYFGTLIDRYGEHRVSHAILSTLRERKATLVPAPPLPPATPPTPTIAGSAATSPTPATTTAPSTPAPAPAPATTAAKDEKTLPGKTNISGACAVCVAPMLLGIGIAMVEWLVGADKQYMIALCRKLEANEITIEDYLKEILVHFDGGIDGLNRISRDFNLALDAAKKMALVEKPELAERPEMQEQLPATTA